MERIPFSWDGLLFRVPLDWELSAFAGYRKAGEFHLSDLDLGERMITRWEESRVPISLKDTAERIKTENEGRGFTFLGKRPFVIRGHKALGFDIEENDVGGTGSIWYCQAAHRSQVAYVRHDGSKQEKEVAKAVISSASCHERGGKRTWAILGLRFRVPAEFQYESAQIALGTSHLILSGPGRHEKIFLIRRDFAKDVPRPEEHPRGLEKLLKSMMKLEVVLDEIHPSCVGSKEGFKLMGHMYSRDLLLRRSKILLTAHSLEVPEYDKHYLLGALLPEESRHWQTIEGATFKPAFILSK